MAKFAIVGTAEVTPGKTEEVVRLLMAHRERCLKTEPGTERFEVLRPHGEENRILAYEVYSDEAAFKTHWEGPNVARMQTEAKGLIVKITATRCTLLE